MTKEEILKGRIDRGKGYSHSVYDVSNFDVTDRVYSAMEEYAQQFMGWTTTKPSEPCVFVAATHKRDDSWSYEVWQLRYIPGPDDIIELEEGEPRLCLVARDNQYEWDDLELLKADQYLILPKH